MQGNSQFVKDKYNTLVVAFRKQPPLPVDPIQAWQKFIKRLFDIVIALAGLVILLPLLVYIALRIKLDSKGSIFYFQERIGYKGMPFIIFKFRSMFEDSEKNGPTLSSLHDKRVTNWGRTMRKWKLDELPQLLNVLFGDMSFVGPRPERKFYIDKVNVVYPYFKMLHEVKPGVTSIGMVKFGYAQNIDQIIQRMKYDLSYVETFSLLLDFQILCYTFPAIIKGRLFPASMNITTTFQQVKLRTLN